MTDSAPTPSKTKRQRMRLAMAIALVTCASSLAAQSVRAPSQADVQAYLAAKGMGMARAAERDGIPGPFHVLTMTHELGLSDTQLRKTQEVFAAMEAQTSQLGREIIAQERALDQQLSDPRSHARERDLALARVGQLHKALREAHQAAHEAQRRILTSEQISLYRTLRAQAAAVAQKRPLVIQAAGDSDR